MRARATPDAWDYEPVSAVADWLDFGVFAALSVSARDAPASLVVPDRS
jgi:hypothetical protein